MNLNQIVTASEAARLYGVTRGSVMYHIDKGNLKARRVGGPRRGEWLIDLDSLIRLWGSPKKIIVAS